MPVMQGLLFFAPSKYDFLKPWLLSNFSGGKKTHAWSLHFAGLMLSDVNELLAFQISKILLDSDTSNRDISNDLSISWSAFIEIRCFISLNPNHFYVVLKTKESSITEAQYWEGPEGNLSLLCTNVLSLNISQDRKLTRLHPEAVRITRGQMWQKCLPLIQLIFLFLRFSNLGSGSASEATMSKCPLLNVCGKLLYTSQLSSF